MKDYLDCSADALETGVDHPRNKEKNIKQIPYNSRPLEFRKLTTNDFYMESDSLSKDGEDFKEGVYYLRFPNGVIREYYVKVEKRTGQVQVDMNGYPDKFPIKKAYIDEEFLGSPIKIYLRETGIEILIRE